MSTAQPFTPYEDLLQNAVYADLTEAELLNARVRDLQHEGATLDWVMTSSKMAHAHVCDLMRSLIVEGREVRGSEKATRSAIKRETHYPSPATMWRGMWARPIDAHKAALARTTERMASVSARYHAERGQIERIAAIECRAGWRRAVLNAHITENETWQTGSDWTSDMGLPDARAAAKAWLDAKWARARSKGRIYQHDAITAHYGSPGKDGKHPAHKTLGSAESSPPRRNRRYGPVLYVWGHTRARPSPPGR